MGEYIGKNRAARLWAKIKSGFLSTKGGTVTGNVAIEDGTLTVGDKRPDNPLIAYGDRLILGKTGIRYDGLIATLKEAVNVFGIDGKWVDVSGATREATDAERGLMSAADKKRLDGIYHNAIVFVPEDYADLNNINVSLTYNFIMKRYNDVTGTYEEEATGLVIPSASADHAGLMSVQDKSRLDVIHNAGAVKSIYFNESYGSGVELGVTRINPNGSGNDIEEYVQIPNATPTDCGVMSDLDKEKLDRFVFGPELVTAVGTIGILNGTSNADFRKIVAAAAKVKVPRVIYGGTNGTCAATYTCVVDNKGTVTLMLHGGGVGAWYQDMNSLSGTVANDMITLDGVLNAAKDDVTFEYTNY